jgi:predicted dehydrogenase
MKSKKLHWGILSSARIALQKVIPAIQKSQRGTVTAIASRDVDVARQVAQSYQIPVICPSYEDLINLREIDAIYIPLPNHLHVEWASRALEAGKHVLCEKPLGMNKMEVKQLQRTSRQYPKQLISEAFMYRYHPQWRRTRQLIRSKNIGELQSIHVHFSYDNKDPGNIRNKLALGGGALMDIGCYGISVARWLFEGEPRRVCARMVRHPEFGTDIFTTILLDFPQGSATVVCATQMQRHQRVTLVGSHGQITLYTPFNALPDEIVRLEYQDGNEHSVHEIGPADQFAEQCDHFAAAAIDGKPLLTPISDSVCNMHVIDACFQSAQTDVWVNC